MFGFPAPKAPSPVPPPKPPRKATAEKPYGDNEVMLVATDDLMTRAEKLCWCLGVGKGWGLEVTAFRILQKYEAMDKERAAQLAEGSK